MVSEALRNLIISDDLDLGSLLSEARIASKLQVSCPPVRKAINRREMEGLLVIEPQLGSFVFFPRSKGTFQTLRRAALLGIRRRCQRNVDKALSILTANIGQNEAS